VTDIRAFSSPRACTFPESRSRGVRPWLELVETPHQTAPVRLSCGTVPRLGEL
jgi:hypothetical protein